MRIATAALALLLLPGMVAAHHSRAEFADETVELVGEITNVVWRNPHIAIFLDVLNDDGEIENWRVETFGAPKSFENGGVTRDLFRNGDRLTLAGRISTRRPLYILGSNALLPSGTEAILGSIYQPYWDGPYVGGATEFTGNNPQVVDAEAENLGIFRVWSIPGRAGSEDGGVELSEDFPFTPEALESREEWDVVDNPIARCEQPGMPVTVIQPVIFRFLREGPDIVLHSSFFDTRRTIHMDSFSDPAAQPRTHLGFSVGQWEDDTLVIRTSRIDYPYFIQDGTRQSENVAVIERYSLNDNQTRLDLHMTIIDDFTFSRPATYQWHFLALGEPFAPYECNVF